MSTPTFNECARSVASLGTLSVAELRRCLSDIAIGFVIPSLRNQLLISTALHDGYSMIEKTIVHGKDSSVEPLYIVFERFDGSKK